MTDKQTEALKLALELALDVRANAGARLAAKAIALTGVIDAALAEQLAQGCDYCNHPQYAGTKCKNCGSEQPAQQQEPVNKYCCHLCFNKSGQMFLDRMILCPEGGNKRCPKATYHELPCTNSNEPGQPGSIYTSPPASKPWVGLTDEEIEKGRGQTFSINNPYCPCDSKTMRKAVRWAEAKLREKNA